MKLTNIIAEQYEQVNQKEQDRICAQTPGVVTLLSTFEEYIAKIALAPFRSIEHDYPLLEEKFENLSYTQKDITELSILFKNYSEKKEKERMGVFLSALINVHYKKMQAKKEIEKTEEKIFPEKSIKRDEEEDYLLIFSEHKDAPLYVGMKNAGASIHIEGNVKYGVGMNMESGLIHIHGSSGIYTGLNMTGGSIIVDENANEFLGTQMQGGEILICGNAESGIGLDMKNGKIIINGTYNTVISRVKAFVYHNGRSILEIEEDNLRKKEEE